MDFGFTQHVDYFYVIKSDRLFCIYITYVFVTCASESITAVGFIQELFVMQMKYV